jgi:hypothetical protein
MLTKHYVEPLWDKEYSSDMLAIFYDTISAFRNALVKGKMQRTYCLLSEKCYQPNKVQPTGQ